MVKLPNGGNVVDRIGLFFNYIKKILFNSLPVGSCLKVPVCYMVEATLCYKNFSLIRKRASSSSQIADSFKKSFWIGNHMKWFYIQNFFRKIVKLLLTKSFHNKTSINAKREIFIKTVEIKGCWNKRNTINY